MYQFVRLGNKTVTSASSPFSPVPVPGIPTRLFFLALFVRGGFCDCDCVHICVVVWCLVVWCVVGDLPFSVIR